MRLVSSSLSRMPATKLPISSLPLPPKSHILTHNLTPDPKTGHSAYQFRNEVLTKEPSVQRRARLVHPEAHFSRVTPMNLPFPYRIAAPEDAEIDDQAAFIEQWLSEREPVDERPLAPARDADKNRALKKYSRNTREIKRELIALSDSCLRDCLPHLDIGDAFAHLGKPTLSESDETSDDPNSQVDVEQNAVRQELVDVLTGHSVLMAVDENGETSYTPWSLRYSGHQFGSWAGQLGDGRAISILETPHPSNPELYELQLKGAGRTPYSRSADGLAVLRSSIREFLCSEAMHALRIPTTRGLALIHLEDLSVLRETVETGCVLTRVAPSFLRIGSFEALNPPHNMFFLGGGQQPAHFDALRILGEWVSRRVLRLGAKEGEPWGKKLVLESARLNAEMVARWQVFGFMHGVINTDNVSILGLTIDYGPYAFMDIFDYGHICNHSDDGGRYAYKFQPTMILYALRALLNSLAPLIGAEKEASTAVKPGWADDMSKEKIEEWTKKGLELEDEMKALIEDTMEKAHWSLFRKRLGLENDDPSDPDNLIRPLLDILERHKLDFHSTFRTLCSFRPSLLAADNPDGLKDFVASIAANSFDTSADDVDFTRDVAGWLVKYAERIEGEVSSGVWALVPNGTESVESTRENSSVVNGAVNGQEPLENGESGEESVWKVREAEMRKVNPRFVLRQWVLEEIIKRVQEDPSSGKRALAKIHEMATHPFEPWGAELDQNKKTTSALSPEEKEERRFCGLGAKKFIGFQCSCSS